MNDVNDVPAAARRTAVQKCVQLDLMLGQLTNFCPVISRNSIVKHSTSLADVWQQIREHFGFQSTVAQFLDLINLNPTSAWILTAFIRTIFSLLGMVSRIIALRQTSTKKCRHHSKILSFICRLQLINPGLPLLVRQR